MENKTNTSPKTFGEFSDPKELSDTLLGSYGKEMALAMLKTELDKIDLPHTQDPETEDESDGLPFTDFPQEKNPQALENIAAPLDGEGDYLSLVKESIRLIESK